MAREDPTIYMRLPESIKAMLTEAAARSRRSIAAETAARLAESLNFKRPMTELYAEVTADRDALRAELEELRGRLSDREQTIRRQRGDMELVEGKFLALEEALHKAVPLSDHLHRLLSQAAEGNLRSIHDEAISRLSESFVLGDPSVLVERCASAEQKVAELQRDMRAAAEHAWRQQKELLIELEQAQDLAKRAEHEWENAKRTHKLLLIQWQEARVNSIRIPNPLLARLRSAAGRSGVYDAESEAINRLEESFNGMSQKEVLFLVRKHEYDDANRLYELGELKLALLQVMMTLKLACGQLLNPAIQRASREEIESWLKDAQRLARAHNAHTGETDAVTALQALKSTVPNLESAFKSISELTEDPVTGAAYEAPPAQEPAQHLFDDADDGAAPEMPTKQRLLPLRRPRAKK